MTTQRKLLVSWLDLDENLNTDMHRISFWELFERLNTNPDYGLTHADAKTRLMLNGRNALRSTLVISKWRKIYNAYINCFSVMQFIAAVVLLLICLVQYTSESEELDFYFLWSAIIIVVIVLVTGTVTYKQQSHVCSIIKNFNRTAPQYATVLREGETITVPADELVLGDIVELMYGDRIPADIRIISAKNFFVDNFILTGEQSFQARIPNQSHENPMKSSNLAFYSTSAAKGSAMGVVIACGDHTVAGRIVTFAAGLKPVDSQLILDITNGIRKITVFICVLYVIHVSITLIMGTFGNMVELVSFIGLMLAATPEGLLTAINICLWSATNHMEKQNCVFKNARAVESLGNVNVICTHKSGIITQNRMVVTRVWFDNMMYDIDSTEISDNKIAKPKINTESPTFQALVNCAVLSTSAEFSRGDTYLSFARRPVLGDHFEAAMIRFVETTYGDIESIRSRNVKIAEVSWSLASEYQFTVCRCEQVNLCRFILVLTGTLTSIIHLCSTILIDGQEIPLSDAIVEKINDVNIRMRNLGDYVFAFCDKMLKAREYPKNLEFDVHAKDFELKGLRFLGLMSMIDPPRPSVPNAIAKCRQAGVKVILMSTDPPVTAKAMAKRVGLLTYETIEDISKRTHTPLHRISAFDAKAIIVHGDDMQLMTPNDLTDILKFYREIIFACIRPQQQYRIVEALQNAGAVVAAAGHSLHDAPTLRKANVGVAMGSKGSDVTRAAANMIVMDDNFATIVNAIEDGRWIYDNLKKVICYTLASNMAQAMPFFAVIIFHIPFAINVFTILLMELGTDLLASISLIHEKPELNYMNQLPRFMTHDSLVKNTLISLACCQIGAIEAAAGFFGYFVVMSESGFLPNLLFKIGDKWYDQSIDDLTDSYGQEWTYKERIEVNYYCQTAFFVSVVVTQWINLIVCKTRRLSILKQGMRNYYLNFALLFETCLALFFVYGPFMNYLLNTSPLRLEHWLLPIPFAVVILIYDEMRRYLLISNQNGWVERETYY